MTFRHWWLAIRIAHGSIGALVALLSIVSLADSAESVAAAAVQSDPLTAEFRGCESAQRCRFAIKSPANETLIVVQPRGVIGERFDDQTAIAVRNRLNSLLSNMIHQDKHIELQALRILDNGRYSANVKVNGMDLRADPMLIELMESAKK